MPQHARTDGPGENSDHNSTQSVESKPATESSADPAASGYRDKSTLDSDRYVGTAVNSVSIVSQRYLIGDEIARGGMGIVYHATDTVFSRDVAIKVLQDRFDIGSGSGRRFADEARITGQLQHPAIPPVHDLGTLPDGRPFLAMKLIKGNNLEDLLKIRKDLNTDRGHYLGIFEQVCQALAYAHAHKVIHRDLKPANVMVGNFGEVQVMDWGLAKVLGSGFTEKSDLDETNSGTAILTLRDSDSSVTQAGSVLGTPAFMPPEQAIGAINKIDTRSDVFGLGAILAVILTGKPPFMANSVETTRIQAAQGNLEDCFSRLDASGAEPELVHLCKKCLSKKPNDRPPDASEVARTVAALRAVADERARQAELDRVKAEGERSKVEATAAEQKKRRRVQLALAGFVVLVTFGGGLWYQNQRLEHERELIATQEKTRADARAAELVKSLASSDTTFVPRIIEELSAYRIQSGPNLTAMLANTKSGSKEQLHASLALLPDDPDQIEYLFQRLLVAAPAEILVIRQSLTKHTTDVNPRLWTVAEDLSPANAQQRLRALAALAGLDPKSERWAKLAGQLAGQLVVESPVLLGDWLKVFQSARMQLLKPLADIYRQPLNEGADANLKDQMAKYQHRSVAVNWLMEYAFDQPALLADYLMDADTEAWAVLWPSFEKVNENGVPVFLAELTKHLPAALPSADPYRENLGKRQANAAVALLRLGKPELVWPLLKHSPDPRVRSYIIHKLSPMGADARAIVRQLEAEKDITIRRALLLSLGEFQESEFTPDDRKTMLPKLQELYKSEPDAGLHAASEWLLRTWKQEAWLNQVNEEWAKDKARQDKKIAGIKELIRKDKEKTPPQWYVNTQGQSFVVLPGPVEILMGSPKSEKDREEREVQHTRRINRSFAIASKTVTLAQYRKLISDMHEISQKYTSDQNFPVVNVDWYLAAAYCNLLSKEEGIPEDQWCYTITGPRAIKLKSNALSLDGYRLPTEAEAEYVIRAGATTSRYYGETEELMGNYAWYTKNSHDLLLPVGKKKPNDLGIFDAHGNCYIWCNDECLEYPIAKFDVKFEDMQEGLIVNSTRNRVLRGGSFLDLAEYIRSAYRGEGIVPTFRHFSQSIRPAKTLNITWDWSTVK